jgi:hypothetical protein
MDRPNHGDADAADTAAGASPGTAAAAGATLAIVERAYRGTLEQQYAHVLWLVHGLHRQSPMVLLLRGVAASYALAGRPDAPPRVGGAPWGTAPDYQAAIGRLVADGAPVLVCARSLRDLDLHDRPLLPEVRAAGDDEIIELIESCRRVWYL